jgi:hypothetical protein
MVVFWGAELHVLDGTGRTVVVHGVWDVRATVFILDRWVWCGGIRCVGVSLHELRLFHVDVLVSGLNWLRRRVRLRGELLECFLDGVDDIVMDLFSLFLEKLG